MPWSGYSRCGGAGCAGAAPPQPYLTKMGYRNVYSIDGGWKNLKDLLPVE